MSCDAAGDMQLKLVAKIERSRATSKVVKVRCRQEDKKLERKAGSIIKLKCIMTILIDCSFLFCKSCETVDPQDKLAPRDLERAPSNHTSYFLDSDTNSTGASRLSDNRAILQRIAAADKIRSDWQAYENISLPLLSGTEARRLPLPMGEIVFDDEEENEEGMKTNEGGEEDYDDDDDDDDDQFYSKNPVDLTEFNHINHGLKSDNKARNKLAKNKKSRFKSKQGTPAIDLESFYKPRASKIQTRAQKRRHKRKKLAFKKTPNKFREKQADSVRRQTRDMPSSKLSKSSAHKGSGLPRYITGESRRQRHHKRTAASATTNSALECLLPLASGRCISTHAIEWSIRRARRLIGFEQPDSEALNSLEPSEATLNAVGELNEWTSRILAIKFGLSSDEINFGLEQIDVSRTSLWRSCPRLFRSPVARRCQSSSTQATLPGRFRSHTGQCNNLMLPHLGSSFMPFARLMAAEYGDGVGSLRRSVSLNRLPPARLVSLQLHPNFERTSDDLSALFAMWGQLINHDLALASGARPATGHEGSCCSRSALAQSAEPADALNRVCAPIPIDVQDPFYGPYGVRCHDFKRSIAALRPGCSLGPRTQLNLVSSFVDGSFVYGSTQSTGRSLRTTRGRLATWNYFRSRPGPASARLKPLLPPQTEAPDEECSGRPEGLFCFRSGDLRTNQQVPLVVLHTLHTRQHNRLADGLAALNPHWSPGRVYEEARRIHIAQIQHILLNEYLPLLLGRKLCAEFNLTEVEPAHEHWHAYEPAEQPGISQEFAAAAFRQGHSSVPNEVFRFDVLTRQPVRLYRLRELFRQPWPLFEPGAMDEFALGLLETPAHSVDPFVSLELTGHLLQEPDEPIGLDLIAINIQRGRDQGVASYNSVRQWCGLEPLESFADLGRFMSKSSGQLFASLYESVHDIDLYPAGLSEWPLEGAQVGPTFACIIGRQFRALRAADRHWFEASPLVAGPLGAFTSGQLASIKQFTLARLLCSNSDALQLVQVSAMQLAHPVLNPRLHCDLLPDLDLAQWLELPPASRSQQSDEDR